VLEDEWTKTTENLEYSLHIRTYVAALLADQRRQNWMRFSVNSMVKTLKYIL